MTGWRLETGGWRNDNGATGDTRRTPRSSRLALCVVALLSAAAEARSASDDVGVRRWPSDFADVAALQAALRDPAVRTIVFERGTHTFSETLAVFGRDDLVLCGATGDPSGVTISSTALDAVTIEQARRTTLRDLTIRTTSSAGAAVRIASVVFPGPTHADEIESYADDTLLDHCALEGPVGALGEVRARHLTMLRCRVKVTATAGSGVLWNDGPGLLCGNSRFTSAEGVSAFAAVTVAGASDPASEGQRANHVLLARNVVDGDFARGFDLSDVTDVQVEDNVIRFRDPWTARPVGTLPARAGRIGIVVRSGRASAMTEAFSVSRNVVRNAHCGAWIAGTGDGTVARNDFRRSGSPSTDAFHRDTGAAMRLDIAGALCPLTIERNDCRGLRSPAGTPAVVVFPAGVEASCFPFDTRNRVDAGRPLDLGEQRSAPR